MCPSSPLDSLSNSLKNPSLKSTIKFVKALKTSASKLLKPFEFTAVLFKKKS
jgi:hypothetical protein